MGIGGGFLLVPIFAAVYGLQVPWLRHMVERFVQKDKDLLALLSNGELWLKRLGESRWHQILSEIAAIKAIAASH